MGQRLLGISLETRDHLQPPPLRARPSTTVPPVIPLPQHLPVRFERHGKQTVGCWHLPFKEVDLGLIFKIGGLQNLKMAFFIPERGSSGCCQASAELALRLVWECFCLPRRGCGLVLLSWDSDSWNSCSKVKSLKL